RVPLRERLPRELARLCGWAAHKGDLPRGWGCFECEKRFGGGGDPQERQRLHGRPPFEAWCRGRCVQMGGQDRDGEPGTLAMGATYLRSLTLPPRRGRLSPP